MGGLCLTLFFRDSGVLKELGLLEVAGPHAKDESVFDIVPQQDVLAWK